MNNKKINNKMAEMPINKLLLTTGTPIILSMMLQAVYNIVDSAFVSNMKENGEAALNALTLAFPVQMLIVAVAIGTGVGTNALLSKTLGRGDKEKAACVVGNSMFLSLIIYVLFFLFGIFGVKAYILSQTNNNIVGEMAVEYLKICCVYSFGMVFFSLFEKILQATGKSLYSTVAQITGAVVNIVLDPILIYGLLGFKKMGVKGAAVATVIGQISSLVLSLIFHLRHNKEIKNGVAYLKPSFKIFGEIYAIGLPAIISQALMSFMTYALNIIYGKIGDGVVTAYGLYYKIQQFVFFAAFGMRDAITPVISFNHGMKNKNRMTKGIKYGIIYTAVIMLAGTLLAEIFATQLAALFSLSGETEKVCISAICIVSASFVFAGINIALQGVFQALNSGIHSLVISLIRQLLPVALCMLFLSAALSNAANVRLMWLSFDISEVVALFTALILMKNVYKKQIKSLEG